MSARRPLFVDMLDVEEAMIDADRDIVRLECALADAQRLERDTLCEHIQFEHALLEHAPRVRLLSDNTLCQQDEYELMRAEAQAEAITATHIRETAARASRAAAIDADRELERLENAICAAHAARAEQLEQLEHEVRERVSTLAGSCVWAQDEHELRLADTCASARTPFQAECELVRALEADEVRSERAMQLELERAQSAQAPLADTRAFRRPRHCSLGNAAAGTLEPSHWLHAQDEHELEHAHACAQLLSELREHARLRSEASRLGMEVHQLKNSCQEIIAKEIEVAKENMRKEFERLTLDAAAKRKAMEAQSAMRGSNALRRARGRTVADELARLAPENVRALIPMVD